MVRRFLLYITFSFLQLFFTDAYNEARLKLLQAFDNTDLGSEGGDSPITFKRIRMYVILIVFVKSAVQNI